MSSPLLIIQPNAMTLEAHEWLVNLIVEIMSRVDLDVIDEDTGDKLVCAVERLDASDVDEVFASAIDGLLSPPD